MTADTGLAKQRSPVACRWKSGKVTKTLSVFMCKCIHTLNLNFISKISLYIRRFFSPETQAVLCFWVSKLMILIVHSEFG